MRPGERLRAAARLIPRGSRVADIGSDHGLLPALLLRSRRSPFCIATEREPRLLDSIHGTIRRQRLQGRMIARSGDGLAPLEPGDEIDTVTMTGLGARRIVRILDDPRLRRLAIARLILQPQSESWRVRRWLYRHGFDIVGESLSLDRGRRYETIAASAVTGPLAPEHDVLSFEQLCEAGPCLICSTAPHVRDWWEWRLRRAERLVRIARGGTGRDRAERERSLAAAVLSVLPARL